MKNEFPKIISDQFPHDMSPWLTEKSENALKAVIELKKLLKGNIPLKKCFEGNSLAPYEVQNLTFEDEVNEAFQAILWDLTKIYGFSNGADWEPSDRDLILDKLDGGLEELQVKYGLLDKTQRQIQKEQHNDFINELKRLLSGERSPNRTFLHELFENNRNILDKNTIQGRIFINIENELENVTEGVLEWSDFVIRAREYLNML
jgi:hypothetical protein